MRKYLCIWVLIEAANGQWATISVGLTLGILYSPNSKNAYSFEKHANAVGKHLLYASECYY